METPKKTTSIADIKLTRSELIDLIVDDVLEAKINEVYTQFFDE